MRQYTECIVDLRHQITALEDIMLNDRNVVEAHELSKEIRKTAAELSMILICEPSLRLPYWTPRLVDADTRGQPTGSH